MAVKDREEPEGSLQEAAAASDRDITWGLLAWAVG